jgi:hypothetical protein
MAGKNACDRIARPTLSPRSTELVIPVRAVIITDERKASNITKARVGATIGNAFSILYSDRKSNVLFFSFVLLNPIIIGAKKAKK